MTTINNTPNTWEYLCSDNLVGDKPKVSIPQYELKMILDKSHKNIKYLINMKLNDEDEIEKFLKIYVDDTYEVTSFHNVAELLQYVSPSKNNKKEWEHVVNKLNNYNEKIKNSVELFKKIKYIRDNHKIDKYEIFLLNNIILNYISNGILKKNVCKKSEALKYHETKLTYDITKKLLSPTSVILNKNDIDTTECLLNINQISDAEVELIHDKNIYPHLTRLVKTDMSRKILERSYFMVSRTVLKDFIKLVMCRHELAKQLGYSNYALQLTNNIKELDEAQEFIKEMVNNLGEKYELALQQIYMYSNKKLQYSDILHYISQIRTEELKTKFSVNLVLNIIFWIIKEYFGLHFIVNKKYNGWHKDVLVVEVYDNNKQIYGHLYLDLLKRPDKIVTPTVFINNHSFNYPYGSDTQKVPAVTLVAGFDSLDQPILTIRDYNYLFRLFGKIVTVICDKSKFGLGIFHSNKEMFMEKLFEWLSMNDTILSKLNIQTAYKEEIINSFELENIINLMNTCIDAQFDILINTSDKFIDLCKKLLKENKDMISSLEKIYYEIYYKYMKPYDKYINKLQTINPNLIYTITDNNNRLLYKNIYDKISAFNVYNHMLKYKDGIKFRKNILENNTDEIKDIINSYLETPKEPKEIKQAIEIIQETEMNRFDD
jgi:hypothetical protein